MAQNYEDIVRDWYNRLRPEFLRRLTARYSGLTLYDAENLYQDTFIAIQENLMQGRIKENTSWSSYIMTIGMNMASKAWRKLGKTDSTDEGYNDENEHAGAINTQKLEEKIREISDDDEDSIYKNEEALSLLSQEMSSIPELCRKIIFFFYANKDMSMDDIAEEFGLKNADTAKAKKSQCMKTLIERVTRSLRDAGFDVTPKKWNRNGKN